MRSYDASQDPLAMECRRPSLACVAGLDEEGFPSKPDAPARESVLRKQQTRGNPEINEWALQPPCRAEAAASPLLFLVYSPELRRGKSALFAPGATVTMSLERAL